MTPLDRWIQRWRIAKVRRYIAPGARVLDIGCHDGALFDQLGDRVGSGVGVDPLLEREASGKNYRLLPGTFPEALDGGEREFDVITMLAVLEHIPLDRQGPLVDAIREHLRPGGRVVITVPSPFVDRILDVLQALRLVHGMSLEEHWGFEPAMVPEIFSRGFEPEAARTFQLGLNHLFVFRRAAAD